MLGRAGRSDHGGPPRDRQLDDHQPDPARTAVDENGVAAADAGRDQRVHGSHPGQQQSAGLSQEIAVRLGHDASAGTTSCSA